MHSIHYTTTRKSPQQKFVSFQQMHITKNHNEQPPTIPRVWPKRVHKQRKKKSTQNSTPFLSVFFSSIKKNQKSMQFSENKNLIPLKLVSKSKTKEGLWGIEKQKYWLYLSCYTESVQSSQSESSPRFHGWHVVNDRCSNQLSAGRWSIESTVGTEVLLLQVAEWTWTGWFMARLVYYRWAVCSVMSWSVLLLSALALSLA